MADETVRWRLTAESELPKLLTDLDSLIRKQNDLGDENSRAIKSMNANIQSHAKQYDTLGDSITSVRNMLVTAFGLSEIKDAIAKVFDLTATYQKYTAALSVGLGSQKKAAEALDMLQGYADKTNFTLDELADTFTKLANRGLVVSRQEMVKLGDVANTLQKPFGDLVEAILDVNNTERWNELGIKAKTNGDKVSLTFKGVTLEVDRTEKGVLSAITTFGTLNGVQGATAAQALTLSGRLSTLEDSASGVGRTVGKAMTPAFEDAIDAAGGMIKVIAGSNSAFDRTVDYVKAAAAALTTFQVVTNAAEIKTVALSAAMAAKEVVMKSYQIVVGTSQIAMQALSSAMGANITITTAASTAARSFWAALSANPIGLIVTAVGVATSAYYAWKGAHAEVNVEIDAATEKLIKERIELSSAVLAVQGYSQGTKERTVAVQQLMDKYPGLIGYTDADKVSNLELNKALANQIGLLDSKIKYAAAAAQADVVYNKQVEINKEQLEIIIKLRGAYKELSEAYPDNDKFVAALKRKQEAEYSNAESMRNMSTAAMAASGSIVAFSGETAKYTELQKRSAALSQEMSIATIEVSKASANSTNAQVTDIQRQLRELEAAHKAKKVNDDDFKKSRQELLDEIRRLNDEEVKDEVSKIPKLKAANDTKKEHAFLTANEIAVLTKGVQEKSLKDEIDLIEAKMRLEIERINTHKDSKIKTEQQATEAIKEIITKAEADKEKVTNDYRAKAQVAEEEKNAKIVEITKKLNQIVAEANQEAGKEVIKVNEEMVKKVVEGKMTEAEAEQVLQTKVTELRQETAEKVQKIEDDTAKIINETRRKQSEATQQILEEWIGNYSEMAGLAMSSFNDYTNSLENMKVSQAGVSSAQDNLNKLITSGKASSEDLANAKKDLSIAQDKEAESAVKGAQASLGLASAIAQVAESIKNYLVSQTLAAYEAINEAIGRTKDVIADLYDAAIENNKTAMDIELENFQGSYEQRKEIMESYFARERELAERKDTIVAEMDFQQRVLTSTSDTTDKISKAWDISKGPIGPAALFKIITAFKEHHAEVLAAAYEREAKEAEMRVARLQDSIEKARKERDVHIQAIEDELDAFVSAKEEEISKLEDFTDTQIDAINEQLAAAKDAYDQQTSAVKAAYDEQLSALKDAQSQEKAALQATYDFKQQLLEQSKADETEAIVIVDRLRNDALERYRTDEVNRLTATRNRILATLTDEDERQKVTNAYAQKIADVHKEVEDAKLDKTKGVSLATKQLNQESKDGAIKLKEEQKDAITKLDDDYQTKFTDLAKDRDAKLEALKNDYIKRETDLKATIAKLQADTAAIIKGLEDEITAKKKDASTQKAGAERDYANFVLEANKQIMRSQIQMAIAQIRAEIAMLQGKRNIFNRGKIDAAVGDLEGSISQLEAILGQDTGGIVNVPDTWTNGAIGQFIQQRKADKTPFRDDNYDVVTEAYDASGNQMVLTYTDEDRRFTAYDKAGNQFTIRNATGYVAATGKSYFEGTPWVEGLGYPDGRDTVPAMVNKGERILPTALNEMLGGPALSNEKLVEGFRAFEKLKQKFGSVRIEEFGRLNFDLTGGRLGTSVDLKGLEKEVKNLTDVIRSKPELKINVDANRISVAEKSRNNQHIGYYENLYNR